MKNTGAIDKIIASLAMQDYLRNNPINIDGTRKKKRYVSYSLSPETNEARSIKNEYLNDDITEDEYKAWCLRWNLNHGSLPSKL